MLSVSNLEPDNETDADLLPNNRDFVVVIVWYLVVRDVNIRTNRDINEHVILTCMIML